MEPADPGGQACFEIDVLTLPLNPTFEIFFGNFWPIYVPHFGNNCHVMWSILQ
jgi:hypothetical protein